MKSINYYINESLKDDIRKKIKNVYNKIFNSSKLKKFNENSKFLKEYTSRYIIIEYIDKHFDFDDPETYVELEEWGIITFIPTEEKLDNISKNKFLSFIENNKDWELFENNDNYVWFLPAVKSCLLVDLDDLRKYENEIAKQCDDFYNRK